MTLCKYFKKHTVVTPSKQITSHGQGSGDTYASTRYCLHPNSPVDIKQACGWGGASLLRCNGDISQCQLAPEFQPPV